MRRKYYRPVNNCHTRDGYVIIDIQNKAVKGKIVINTYFAITVNITLLCTLKLTNCCTVNELHGQPYFVINTRSSNLKPFKRYL